MSRSNPMHRDLPHPPRKVPEWPFPSEPLDYPGLPPDVKPVKEKPVLPTDEAPF